MTSSSSSATSVVKYLSHVYTWKIVDFPMLPNPKGSPFESPKFRLGPHEWNLQLFPQGKKDAKDGQISIFLHKDQESALAEAFYTITIVKVDGSRETWRRLGEPRHFLNDNMNWGFTNFKKRSNILDENKLFLCPKTKTLTIECEVKLYCGVEDTASFAQESNRANELASKQLVWNYKMLLESGSHADMKFIVGADKAEMPAHRAILSVRSPVFAAMFSNKMLESKEGTVTIEDLSVDVFRCLLEFIYTGETKGLESEFCGKLLAAADRYQVSTLKLVCSATLTEKLSAANLVQLLTLAEMCNAPELLESCKQFVRENPTRLAEAMDVSKGFDKLSGSTMAQLLSATIPQSKGDKKRKAEEKDGPKNKRARIESLEEEETDEEMT